MFEVSLLGVLVGAIGNLIIGFIWYAPQVFGRVWMREAGITPEHMERGKKKMPLMMLIAFVAALIMAYILNQFGIAWGVFDWVSAVELAFWTWLGFMVPVLLSAVLWEGKSWKFWAINAAYWLVALNVMSLIILWLSN